MAANNKRRAFGPTSPNRDPGKKLRQTTLSSLWGSGRGNSTTLLYFAQSSREKTTSDRGGGRGKGKGRGSEGRGIEGRDTGKGREEETDGQSIESSSEVATSSEDFEGAEGAISFEGFEGTEGAINFEDFEGIESANDDFESGNFSLKDSSQAPSEPQDSLTPRQFFFPVPAGYRRIYRVNMASTSPVHHISLQELAFRNIHANEKIFKSSPATPDASLYVERKKYPTYAVDRRTMPCMNYKTKIEVLAQDTVEAAIRMCKESKADIPGVLNMANAERQGGGFLEGTTAQEEQLCYRTTLFSTLKVQFYPLPGAWPRDYPRRPKDENGAPMQNEYSVLYSPSVAIYREAQSKSFAMYEPERAPEIISVLTVAALNLGRYKGFDKKSITYPDDECRRIMREKIRLLLRVAVRRRKTRLVLGALGCGVFRNPPEEVAPIFRELLNDQEFKGYFQHIVFAILPNRGDNRNINVFRKEFKC